MRRTLSLTFASVVIAGPTFPTRDEATAWAARVEDGSEPDPIPITAVGQEALGEGTMPEGVKYLTAGQLDMEAGVEIDAYHELLDVRETDDGWRAIIRADILAAPPLRELDQAATDSVLVAVSGFSSPEEARGWFGSIGKHMSRFFPVWVSVGSRRVTDTDVPTGYSPGLEIDLDNGITTFGPEDDDLAWIVYAAVGQGEEGEWGVLFVAAGIRFATETVTTSDQHRHERGIITSPALADPTAAQDWLEDLRNGNGEAFVPQLVGKAAVEAFGDDKPEDLGEFNHLPQNVDWDNPINVTEVNEHYGTVSTEGGFVVVLNANFTYTAKVAVGTAN